MKLPLMPAFWLYIRIAVMLIVVCSILAAVMVSIDLRGLFALEKLLNVLP